MHRGSVAFIDIKSLPQPVLAVLFAAGIRGLRYSIRKQEHLVSRIEPHCYIPILRTGHRSAYGASPTGMTAQLVATDGEGCGTVNSTSGLSLVCRGFR